MFHTVMGAKYFDELGYTKLYECAIVFDAESNQYYQGVDRIRDLETLEYVERNNVLASSDCDRLFTSERKKGFIRDLDSFNSLTSPDYWARLFRDKGYNGSPFYTFLVSLIVGRISLAYHSLLMVAMIDIALILLAFYMIYQAFGLRLSLLAFIFFGVNFPNRFTHMGGSILRFDYVAYLIIAVSLLKMEKYRLSALFVALASMVRMFPVLFAVGLGLKALVELFRTGTIKRRYIDFFTVFAVCVVLFFILSSSVGRGLDSWIEFNENIKMHNERTAAFRIGFKHLFMVGGEIIGKARQFEAAECLYYLSLTVFLAALVFLMLKLDDIDSTVLFGVLMFYLLFASTRYYYSVLVLLFLVNSKFYRDMRGRLSPILLFALSGITYLVYVYDSPGVLSDAFIYNYLLSSMLAVYFIVILGYLIYKHQSLGKRSESGGINANTI